MTKRPRIGLNMAVKGACKPPLGLCIIGAAYVDAIANAGGLPQLLPSVSEVGMVSQMLEGLDGICFIGGPDYLPSHYGGRVQKTEELMEERRDRFDFELARQALQESNLPVLGVCGGMQLLSLSQGGALVQDIGAEWKPSQSERTLPHAGGTERGTYRYRHQAKIELGSLVAKVTSCSSGSLVINSEHHQAVRPDAIGEGLRATALAPDGVVEAVEPALDSPWAKAGRFVLGVQWHPERMPEEEAHRGIFKALVQAAVKK